MSNKPLKILVCDDERHIVRLIQVNLERQGYTVVTAYDGKEGLEKIRAEKPNLVVLDVMMPYMDGFEVLKTLRREPEFEALPVIMLTAKAQDKDVFEGYHYGADMYLTKPFNPMELVTFVKRIAQGSDGGEGPKRYDL
ncbi:MAG: Alkaline phosphatase synthesis transcriptional regulatory protein PhoP [Fimbriimonadaceae bacterium]|nr:Alkaline phosphatase synthesis transcriptional regulatory protein PhoP [Fimbriimonadaceae bacterium]